MNDIDKKLTKHQPKPKRPLSADFVTAVQHDIASGKRPARRSWLRNHLPASLFSKAGAVGMACLLLVTGTVAAAALWPTPDVQPIHSGTLPNGNRVVSFEAQNCNYFSELDGADPVESSVRLYYEIRKESPLTDQQLQDALRATCEENISNNAVTKIVRQLPSNTRGVQSTMAYRIEAISDSSITVSLDPQYDASMFTTKPHLTYTKFAKDLILYNQSSKAAFEDFAVGDTIKMVVKSSSTVSAETPENYNTLNNPEEITILAMVKIPALTANPSKMYQSIGSDMVRLEPCQSNAAGLCRVYEFPN